jgi:hypothetical protein
MLVRVGERMTQLRVGEAPGVMSPCKGEKRLFASGELEERRPVVAQTAFCTLPPFRQRVQT